MSAAAASQMSIQESQDLLRRYSAIVVTDYTGERLAFDLEGLGALADVDHRMDIQGDVIFIPCKKANV